MIAMTASEARELSYDTYMATLRDDIKNVEDSINVIIADTCIHSTKNECVYHFMREFKGDYLLRVTSAVAGDLISAGYHVAIGDTAHELVISWK